MSTEKEKRKQKIIAVVKEFTSPKHRKQVDEGLKKVEQAKGRLDTMVRELDKFYGVVDKWAAKEAKNIRKNVFINTGNLKIKKALTENEIKTVLVNRTKVKETLAKLKKAQKFLGDAIPKCRKAVDTYSKICQLASAFGDVEKLREEQKKLSSPSSYVDYYRKLATGFASASSAMKELTNKLPPGASDYCNFIFSVAENSAKAAKLVGGYTTNLINEFKEFDKVHSKMGAVGTAKQVHGQLISKSKPGSPDGAVFGK
jgi:hypothetical protein